MKYATVMIQDGSIVKRSEFASEVEYKDGVLLNVKGPHGDRMVHPEEAARLSQHPDGIKVSMKADWAMIRVIPEVPDPEYDEDGTQINEWPEFAEPVWPDVLETIAATRYEHETGGTTINGLHVATDRQSQALITGAFSSAKDAKETGEAWSIRWKSAGGWVELDADQMIAVGRAVRQHVQACFDREKELTEEVEAGTFTESMLDEGWPA